MEATGITLLIVPALYLMVEDVKNMVRWLREEPLESTAPAEPGKSRAIEAIDVEI